MARLQRPSNGATSRRRYYEPLPRASHRNAPLHRRGPSADRNQLIHAYFDVDLDLLWDTATKDLSPLIAALETLLPPEDT